MGNITEMRNAYDALVAANPGNAVVAARAYSDIEHSVAAYIDSYGLPNHRAGEIAQLIKSVPAPAFERFAAALEQAITQYRATAQADAQSMQTLVVAAARSARN